MPVQRGAFTFSRYRVEAHKSAELGNRRWLARVLRRKAFQPIDRSTDDERSCGWVELENPESAELTPTSFMYGDYLLVGWRVDTLRVAGPQLRAELESWVKKFQETKGRPPAKGERKEARDTTYRRLRSKAFPVTKTSDVSWNLQGERLEVWAASRKLIDEIHIAFEETFEVRLHPLSPGGVAAALEVPTDVLDPTEALLGSELAKEVRPHVAQ